MKKIYQILSIVFVIVTILSCNEDILNNSSSESDLLAISEPIDDTYIEVSQYCGTQTWTLWAGQTMDYGTLSVSNDETNLYVTYTATIGDFGTLHLWVGSDLLLLPVNKQGTPIPGQFPYTFDASGLTTYTFSIPLANISFYNGCGNTNFYVVAHAEMSGETAFGGDIVGTGTARWYYYASYAVVCCETTPPVFYEKYGTAFAKGGYVFTTDKRSNPENLPSLALTKNRWGWAINLTSAQSASYNVWVGAGLNNVSKAIQVGTVLIDYTGSQATITYNLKPGYVIEEAHVYADDYRPTTIAPGQFGNLFYFNPFSSTHSFIVDVSDTNGDGVWFIVHAVVYGYKLTNI